MTGGGNCFRILLVVGVVAWIFMLLRVQNAVAGQADSTTPQGVFRLHCGDPSILRTEERLLSGVEKRFYELTGFEPQDYHPVMIVLHGLESSGQALPSLRVDALEGGQPRIQVDLLEQDTPQSASQTARLLIAAMLLRECYHGKAPPVGSSIPKIPAWLSHGLAALCIDAKTQKTIQASYLRGGAPPGIEAFLVERPPDESNHLLEANYDARAACLLQVGLKGERGTIFRKWIQSDSSAKQSGSLSSLSRWPSGWPMQKVEREWLLLMATSSREEKNITEELTSTESLGRYDVIAKAIPIDAGSFEKLRKERGWEFTSQGICAKLRALRFQANPLVIPLIDSTTDLLQSGKALSGKKLSGRLAALTALRSDILRRSQAINAYLDWYEAAKVPVRSGLFDLFLKSPESPVRKGPVGRYLDAVETRGW
ncbi:MAG: hypothetical protein K8R57_09720 [Verrucomicrobia bacterium]|nr:hypothetical protein [Verrucomicrobiota bacterium]